MKYRILAAAALLFCSLAEAKITLPKLISSNMVLQRDAKPRIWGWADPGETVSVKFKGQTKQAKADPDGAWEVRLEPMKGDAAPAEMTIAGKDNTIILKNVVVGDVFFCSGQSNMEFYVMNSTNGRQEVANCTNPNIRIVHACAYRGSLVPFRNTVWGWSPCIPHTIRAFSAVAYFFGRDLQKYTKVPVGLIHSSWGGLKIDPWIGYDGFASRPSLKKIADSIKNAQPGTRLWQNEMKRYLAEVKAWLPAAERAVAQNKMIPQVPDLPAVMNAKNNGVPSAMYNTMVMPSSKYTIRGVVWYQGESNRGDGALYCEKMHALAYSWRHTFGIPDLPIYYVQIAPYRYGGRESDFPSFCEVQRKFQLEDKLAHMAVTIDIGTFTDIHPKMKQPVGARLAALCAKYTFGMKDIKADAPVAVSAKRDGKNVIVSFAEPMISADGQALRYFELADASGKRYPASAQVKGNTVIVSAPQVNDPKTVFYAWTFRITAKPNLFSSANLPAVCFKLQVQ